MGFMLGHLWVMWLSPGCFQGVRGPAWDSWGFFRGEGAQPGVFWVTREPSPVCGEDAGAVPGLWRARGPRAGALRGHGALGAPTPPGRRGRAPLSAGTMVRPVPPFPW